MDRHFPASACLAAECGSSVIRVMVLHRLLLWGSRIGTRASRLGGRVFRYQAPICHFGKSFPAHTGFRGSCEDDDYLHTGGFGVVRDWFGGGFTALAAGTSIAALVIFALVVEYLPKPRVTSALRVPEFVSILKAQPGNGAVLDTVSEPFQTMYYQTVHEKPVALGYSVLSRTPRSVAMKGEELKRLIDNGDYNRLRNEYQIRYLVTDAAKDLERENGSVKTLFGDSKVKLYELLPE
jgi:hypothetical protein